MERAIVTLIVTAAFASAGRHRSGLVVGAMLGLATSVGAQAPRKVEIVSVTGCLREQPANRWLVVNATDPVESRANQALPKEIPKVVPVGKNRFELIGVAEFDLPSLKEQTVVVRGLFIKATPTSRINVTSVVVAAPNCEPGASK